MIDKTAPTSNSALRIRPATAADRPRLIALINSAFSIETFLEGTRTDEERLAATMQKGAILLAEDSSGQLLACVSIEVHGTRGYLGQLAVDPAHQGKGLGHLMVKAAEEHYARRLRGRRITVLSMRPELLPFIAASATSKPASSRTSAPSASSPPASKSTASKCRKLFSYCAPGPCKYLPAKSRNAGQFGPGVCPNWCSRNARSPSDQPRLHRRKHRRPQVLLPQQPIHRPRSHRAQKLAHRGSAHSSPAVFEPTPTNTGRGAHSAISSCASTGRSPVVSGPAYFMKFPAIQ